MLETGIDFSDFNQFELSRIFGNDFFRLLFDHAPAGIALIGGKRPFSIHKPVFMQAAWLSKR